MKRFTRSDLIRAVIETLEEAGGALRDEDLFKTLKREFPDLSARELMKILLQLEFNGCIIVSSIDENTRTIELLKKCSGSHEEE